MCKYQISNILNKIMLNFWTEYSISSVFIEMIYCPQAPYLRSRWFAVDLSSICPFPAFVFVPLSVLLFLPVFVTRGLFNGQAAVQSLSAPFGDFQLCFYGLIAVIFIVCLLAFSRKYSEEWHSPHLSTWPHHQSQGGRLAISERRRTSQSQSRDPQSGKSQSRNRAQSTIGAQTTQGASWYLGVRRWPRIGHTGSEKGVDRSGGQYRNGGREIHKMGVDSCTLYKHVQMYQNGGG